MTDDLDTRLDALQRNLDATLDAFSQRLADSAIATAPAAPQPTAAPAPAAPLTIEDALRQKASEYDPRRGLPEPIVYGLMTTREQDAAQAVIEAERNPNASLDERMEAQVRWQHIWADGRVEREQRFIEYRAEVQEQRRAADAEAVQARVEARAMADHGVRGLAERFANLTIGERFADAVDAGLFERSDDNRAGLGWGPRELALLSGLADRVVEVNPTLVHGRGFQTLERGGKLGALVPSSYDTVEEFVGAFGPDAASEGNASKALSGRWFHSPDAAFDATE